MYVLLMEDLLFILEASNNSWLLAKNMILSVVYMETTKFTLLILTKKTEGLL